VDKDADIRRGLRQEFGRQCVPTRVLYGGF
jgi:hypothetical protein